MKGISMATNNEFEDAFNEDHQVTEPTEDQAFGLTPSEPDPAAAAETASPVEGEPAAVVIVAEADDQGDAAAASEAAAVNDEANAAAATNGKETPATTGEQEAAAAAGSEAPAEPASPSDDAAHGEMPVGGADADDEPTDPKEIQRKKSWEGRLRAEEERLRKIREELEAKAAGSGQSEEGAAAEAVSQAAAEASQDGDTAMADAAQEVAEQIDAGEIDIDAGLAQLTEDFGEPFVRLMQAIARREAGKVADERVGKVAKDVEDVIGHLTDSAERAHFEAIHDVHPDFMEIDKQPDFQVFVKERGAEEIVASGSARQINKLLTDYKSSRPVTEEGAGAPPAEEATPAQDAVQAATDAAPQAMDEAADAAEGVRSAGLRIPERPAPADKDDFASAWDRF